MTSNHEAVDPISSPRNPFTNVRVAITGGTSGLGFALVRELTHRGANVAFVARGRVGVDGVVQELRDAHGVVGDVSQKEEIPVIAMQIVGVLGGLDVLINNASDLGPTPLRLLADTECEDFERALATNVLRPISANEGAARLAGRIRPGEWRSGGGQCVERRRYQCLPPLGGLWREQGGAPPFEPHLGRRTQLGGSSCSLYRSRRYGHASARGCRARCGPLNVEVPRGGSPRAR
jgi:hypothetical protein